MLSRIGEEGKNLICTCNCKNVRKKEKIDTSFRLLRIQILVSQRVLRACRRPFPDEWKDIQQRKRKDHLESVAGLEDPSPRVDVRLDRY